MTYIEEADIESNVFPTFDSWTPMVSINFNDEDNWFFP
jgi:hypothetical protein